MDLGTLTATLGADLGPLQASVAKANAALGKFGSEAKTSFNSIKDSVMSLNGVFVAMAGVGIMKLMEMGATALQVESSFKIMADEVGADADRMIASMAAATKGTIDDSDLMAKATKLMLQGYNPEQIERFSKVAITASIYAGTSVAEAYDRLGDAIANKMPKALVQLGAIFPEQMKLVQKAIAAGADEMVLFNLAMTNLELKEAMLRGTQDGATLAMQRFHAQVHDLEESIGKGLIIILQKLFGVFQFAASGALVIVGAIYKLGGGIDWLLSKLPGKTGKEGKAAYEDDMRNAQAAFDAAADLGQKGYDNLRGYSEQGKKASAEEIAALKAKQAAQMKSLQAFADAAEAQKDILTSLTQSNKDMYDASIEASDHASNMMVLAGQNELASAMDILGQKEEALMVWYDAQKDTINKYSKNEMAKNNALKALDADYFKQWSKYENMKEETVVKTSNFVRTTNEDMYNSINQYSKESIDAQIAAVNRWAEAQKVPGADLGLINRTALDKIAKINIGAANATADSFISAYTEIANSINTTYKAAKGFSDAALDYQLQKFRNQKPGMLEMGWTESDWAAWYNNKAFELELQQQVFLIKKNFDDIIGVAALSATATRDAWLEGMEKLEGYSDSLALGVETAFLRIQKEAMTWAQVADETVMEFSKNAKSTLSTVLFDATKGELKSFMDYWNSFFDALSKKFLDMCSDMVVNWIMAQMKMKSSASSGGGLMGILETAVGWIGGGGNTGGYDYQGALGKLAYGGDSWSVGHSGGVIGVDSFPVRYTSPMSLAGVPRFHSGLAPDEFKFIGQRGERITSKNDVGKESKTPINLSLTNIVSPDLIDSYLSTARGQNSIMNVISAKSGTVRRALRK